MKIRTNITYKDIKRKSMEWNGLVDQMSRDIKPHGVVLVIKIK